MWWIFAKKLKDQEVLDAINTVRDSRGRERDKAFLSLRDYFNKDLEQRLRKVHKFIDSPSEKRDVQAFIERTFFEILLTKSLNADDIRRVEGYIRNVMKARINDTAVRIELGKTKAVQKAEDYDVMVRRGLKKYYQKYRKTPDFKNREEMKELADLMGGITVKRLEEMMKSLGKGTVKSLSEVVGGDNDGNVEVLLDTLQSGDKLPDEIYRDRELARALRNAIQRYLKVDQRRVLMLYYFPDDPKDEGKTKQELAKQLNMPFPTFKRNLDVARIKLKKNPVVNELRHAAFKTRCIKNAMALYEIVKVGNKAYFLYDSVTNDEQIIAEVMRVHA